MEILYIAIYLLNQFLRVNITNISSNDVLPEVVAIYTAYLLVILHCHHWVDDTLQAFLNKTATTKVGSSLNESSIKILQRKLRVTLNSFCNMNSLLVGLFPSLRFLHHRFQRETNIVATIDSIHSNLLSILGISTLIAAHINTCHLQGIYHIAWSIVWNDSLLKLVKTVWAHKLGFKVDGRLLIFYSINKFIQLVDVLVCQVHTILILGIFLWILLCGSIFQSVHAIAFKWFCIRLHLVS